MRFALLLTLLSAAALADEDPPGTVPLVIQAGTDAPIQTVAGSNVLCDNLEVVKPEFTADQEGFVLRGIGPGSTLCGVWFGDQQPGGLYRVTVVATTRAPEQKDGGSVDAGPRPEPARASPDAGPRPEPARTMPDAGSAEEPPRPPSAD